LEAAIDAVTTSNVMESNYKTVAEQYLQLTQTLGSEEVVAIEAIVHRSTNLSFRLYPNPNKGFMTLEYELNDSEGIFEMFDFTGKTVKSQPLVQGKNKVDIEAKELSNGMYWFRIKDNKQLLFNGKIAIIP
jgi:hypothetical protein